MAVDSGQHTIPAGLTQVHPADENAIADIDIIAIHGLDTRSPDTWTWKDPNDAKRQVNWLEDSKMLPCIVRQARIFTCDWPADMFQKSIPTTLEESARFLLQILRQHLERNRRAGKRRPVFFIASCLGGIILIKALEIDRQNGDEHDHLSLISATRGIVFLATPFLGTAFKDMPDMTLKAWALFKDQTVSALIECTRELTPTLEELVRRFNKLAQERHYHVFTFWEAHKTSLLSRVYMAWIFSERASNGRNAVLILSAALLLLSPWPLVLCLLWRLGLPLYEPKQLVDMRSATAQLFEQQRLNRSHVLMNKFRSPECKDYKNVAGKIREIVEKIRQGTPLQKADAWIREKHYTKERLKIERLSGDLLSMDQCYINLAIVEQFSQGTGYPMKEHFTASPFSIFARQKVEAPAESIQIELATIFNQRTGPDGRVVQPRRILIRGRAGVGKTTLCKKIVHEFIQGSWREWTDLFDRILWVPLRNLKLEERRRQPNYDFEHLFKHEYFSLPNNRPDLARELSRALGSKNSKTLFLLDGLDEVSQDLASGSSMSRFLAELLQQPNVIITSRPSTKPPPGLDLELESIGFYSDQVTEYLQMACGSKASEVQSFLEKHWLIKGLVRIPIQLDALCYTWDGFDREALPGTMTGIYKAIESRLWKKDVLRLDTQYDGRLVTASDIETCDTEFLVENEIYFLEGLAFTGLHDEVMDFTPKNLNAASKRYKRTKKLLLDKVLPKLSFLRPSNPSQRVEDREYHFIHLTFQEYFAARHFVRRWRKHEGKRGKQVAGQLQRIPPSSEVGDINPIEFVHEHKYTARYDIFWRFVAGLLDAEGEAGPFITIVEAEPLDLLGPTHQRLVMHCLSEISSKLPMQMDIEQRLADWLLFQIKFRHSADLAIDMEFPEHVLDKVLCEAPEDAKRTILQSVTGRTIIPQSVIDQAGSWLKDQDSDLRIATASALGSRTDLPDEIIKALAIRLEDQDSGVRSVATSALRSQAALPNEILKDLIIRLEHQNSNLRIAAASILGSRADLPDEIIKALAIRLEDQDSGIRRAAISALRSQAALPNEILEAFIIGLEDQDSGIRRAATSALGNQGDLPDEILKALVLRLEDQDKFVREAAASALGRQADLPNEILKALVIRLEDQNSDVRKSAASILGRQAALPNEILKALVLRLEDQDELVRMEATSALGRQAALPNEILKTLVLRLEDQNSDVREAAASALGNQGDLPDEILKALELRLEGQDEFVRMEATSTLGRQADLPNETLKALVLRLEDQDELVRMEATSALGRQAALPNEILKTLVLRLEDQNSDVRKAAASALGNQGDLPDEILKALVLRLEDQDKFVREAAASALGRQADLPNEILKALVIRLEDEKYLVRYSIETTLRRYEHFYGSLVNSRHAMSLYKTSLERSFQEQLSWYIDNSNCYINMPEKIIRSSIHDQHSTFRAMIQQARPTEFPSTCCAILN